MTDGGAPLTTGARVEEFEILRVLGAGGFGVTYLARDTNLACEVAVKEYFPARCAVRRNDGTVGPRSRAHTEEYRWGLERFLREARVLARFDDRRIVRVRRVFEAVGTAYLVMEYVEGRSLAAELKEVGKLPESRVQVLMEQLAAGLEVVHAAGLVHRDIKPGNVMLREDGTPVLIDFGTANQAFGEQSELVQVTPPYAPIEQYGSGEASRRRLGPWTDLYALGAVAYTALSGQRPVEAVERVPVDRMARLETAAPDVSERFATAVMAALAVDAEDRPQTVAAWRGLWDDARGERPRFFWWSRAAIGLAAAALIAVFWIAGGLRPGQEGLADAGNVASAESVEIAPDVAPEPVAIGLPSVEPVAAAGAGREPEAQETRLVQDNEASPTPAVVSTGGVPATTEAPNVELAPPPEPDGLSPLASFRDGCAACPELIVVPAGAFVMGSDLNDQERPTRRVQVPEFAIGRHEVTRGEYAAFVEATDRIQDGGCRVLNDDDAGRANAREASWRAPGFAQHDDEHPAVCVSWADAQAYAAWLSERTGARYRLPSEAEWEYAARSGTTTRHYWEDEASGQCTHANGADSAAAVRFGDWAGADCDDGALYTAPAGAYAENRFGLHDMLGNVSEWVADCWRSSYAGAAPDEAAAWGNGDSCALHVLRGGSWASPPADLRPAFRESNYTNIRSHVIGFRVARTIE